MVLGNLTFLVMLTVVVSSSNFPWGCITQRQQMQCPTRVNQIPDRKLDSKITRLVFMRVVSFNLTFSDHITYIEIRRTALDCVDFADWPITVMLNGNKCNLTTIKSLANSTTTPDHTTTDVNVTTNTTESTTSTENVTARGLSTRKPFSRSHTVSRTTNSDVPTSSYSPPSYSSYDTSSYSPPSSLSSDTSSYSSPSSPSSDIPTSSPSVLPSTSKVTVTNVLVVVVVAVFILIILIRKRHTRVTQVRETSRLDNLADSFSMMSFGQEKTFKGGINDFYSSVVCFSIVK